MPHPFLNGGLFSPSPVTIGRTDIVLPNDLFTNDEEVEEGIVGTGVLDVFDRYNFTSTSPSRWKKKSLSTEMLGKVFENLIEITAARVSARSIPRARSSTTCQKA